MLGTATANGVIMAHNNSPVILWFDLGLIAREGFSNVCKLTFNLLSVVVRYGAMSGFLL